MSPITAAALKYQRRARFATDQDIERTVVTSPGAKKAIEVEKPVSAGKRSRKPRTYKRRDLQPTVTK